MWCEVASASFTWFGLNHQNGPEGSIDSRDMKDKTMHVRVFVFVQCCITLHLIQLWLMIENVMRQQAAMN